MIGPTSASPSSTAVNNPENPTLTVLQGAETVQGLELGATGHIGDKFSVVAGYTVTLRRRPPSRALT